jgi:hypothetical protein
MQRRVAVFVDGENIGSPHAAAIRRIAEECGEVVLARVYGDIPQLNGWRKELRFAVVHSGTGRNATDILMSLDALEMAMEGRFETCMVASSDGGFRHLAVRLREHGVRVVGVGEEKTPPEHRAQCSEFFRLEKDTQKLQDTPAPLPSATEPERTELDDEIRNVIQAHSSKGSGMRITDLNPIMRAKHDVRISERPDKTWRRYFSARPSLYDLDPKGSEARVRFKRRGFN